MMLPAPKEERFEKAVGHEMENCYRAHRFFEQGQSPHEGSGAGRGARDIDIHRWAPSSSLSER
jgi:hypothetical protein